MHIIRVDLFLCLFWLLVVVVAVLVIVAVVAVVAVVVGGLGDLGLGDLGLDSGSWWSLALGSKQRGASANAQAIPRRPSPSADKLVSTAVHRDDVPRLARMVFHLLA